MVIRFALLVSFSIFPAFPQNTLNSFTFGGSGNEAANGVAVDSAGNIYVAGTTTSFDLSTLNAWQGADSGTQLIYSPDAGATWKPLSNPFPAATTLEPLSLAADPSNASTVYVASGNSVCKSTDGGLRFQCVQLPFPSAGPVIMSLAIDPSQPATIYASAVYSGGVFKSTDGGHTWVNASNGLPGAGDISSVAIDPFHPGVLWAWAVTGGYVSRDGAMTWTRSSLPWPSNTEVYSGLFSFDPVTPGILYGPAYVSAMSGVQKSVDGGQTWTLLNPPFSTCCVVPDPKLSGVLYAIAPQPYPSTADLLSKSTDYGATWNSSVLPFTVAGSFGVDPANSRILIAGDYRSADGGITWTQTNASRAVQAVFAPSNANLVYATAPITSDAFVAKFLPDGKTPVFLTYFGGMGNEAVGSIALDGAGNIWIVGNTTSVDLPVTSGAFQKSLKGQASGFVAKFTGAGQLAAATYLGGTGQDSVYGIALGPQGDPWVIGSWYSTDFPFTNGPAAASASQSVGFVAEFDSEVQQLLYAVPVDGVFDATGKGIAIDGAGNITMTGYTNDPNFTVTAGAYHSGAANSQRAFVLKLDSGGNTIYSTYFGGSHYAVIQNEESFGAENAGISVATDPAGNAYVAGTTSSTDFPVTPGAYQTALASGCTYPALEDDTGEIGVLFFYGVGDVFVLKLSADGQTPVYSTLLGGSCYDHPTGIAVDSTGDAYVTGETDSGDFPLIAAVQAAPARTQYSSFVSAINAAGSALTFSTYLLAGATPSVSSGAGGSIVVAGNVGMGAQSQPFIGAYDPYPIVATDSYLAILNPPLQAPPVNLSQVMNGFSLRPGPVAPGEIVVLGLPGFAPSQFTDIGLNILGPLDTNLAGVQVMFDGRPAFVITVDLGKVVCIAPLEIAGQASSAVQVNIDGQLSNVLNVIVADTALGLLSLDGSGMGPANARNADGSLNTASNPAADGSKLTVFLTGAGLTNPAEADGAAPASYSIVPAASITSLFQNQQEGLSLTGSVHSLPGFVPGLFGFDFIIPTEPGFVGQLSVSLESNSSNSQSLYVYVK